ncbi:MAG: sigma-70 family RNA polymerase sigma factor [Vicinamibacterales bacterium]
MSREARLEEFEAVALPNLDALYRTATRLVRDRDTANDIVQETYLQAWKSFERFETGTNCRAWLYKILFHVVQHHRRKWFRFDMRFVPEGEHGFEETVAAEPPVRTSIGDKEVLDALDTLPLHYRAVVLLVDVQELSYKEAAEALELPMGTVMSRLNRGRRLLRHALSGYASSFGIGVAGMVNEHA